MSNPGERHYFGGPPHSNNLSRDPDLNGLFSSGFSSGLPLGRGEQHTHTLRGMDPNQYAAALDFEEIRLRHQLEVQHDIDFRRRLMEEQQNQFLSELEYRSKIQHLHEQHLHEQQLHEQHLQEQQQRQRQQQQQHQHGLSQLFPQNSYLMELQQQQQQQNYQSGQDNSLLAYLRDDFLMQRHAQMLQDQMKQQLQEQVARESQQHEQEELLAMLQAGGNLGGMHPSDLSSFVSSLRQEQMMANQIPSSLQSPGQSYVPSSLKMPSQSYDHPPPSDNSLHLLENSVDNLIQPRADSSPTHQDGALARKRSHSESMDMNVEGTTQGVPKKKRAGKPKKGTSEYLASIAEKKEKALALRAAKKAAKDQAKEVARELKLTLGSEKPKKVRQKKTTAIESPDKEGEKSTGTTDNTLNEKGAKPEKGPSVAKDAKKGSSKEGKKMSSSSDEVVDGDGLMEMESTAISDDEAVEIVLNFQRCAVPDSDVQQVKKWGKYNPLNQTYTYPTIPPESIPFITPGLKFNLPSLPIEPEIDELDEDVIMVETTSQPEADVEVIDGKTEPAEKSQTSHAGMSNPLSALIVAASDSRKDAYDAMDIRFIGTKKKVFKPKPREKGDDDWWPSDECISNERSKIGEKHAEEDTDEDNEDAAVSTRTGMSFVNGRVVEATKRRLNQSVEPGVLEKLPHCYLYDENRPSSKGSKKKMFCCQTTEMFPFEPMVCCTICSTWRHAQCGGHYKRYTAESVDPSNLLFEAVCDQCYLEKKVVEIGPEASTRLDQQRTEHLRQCNATNAVIRQMAFAKHSGQYKWPLGSVSTSHILGHVRSVQSRHDKAEKQWKEMVTRLGSLPDMKPRESQRVRMREFERLLTHVEDAEGAMDRHNMMLFLQNDTSKLHPAGFEVPRRNIFDPEEDPIDNVSEVGSSIDVLDLTDSKIGKSSNLVCARIDCDKRSRFDSIFCSDSCGVSTLEKDLLHSLQFAAKLHPSVLR